MLNLFLIYASLSALIVVPWFTVSNYEYIEAELEQRAKDAGATKGQMLAAMYGLLVLLGWVWLPYKVFSMIRFNLKINKYFNR